MDPPFTWVLYVLWYIAKTTKSEKKSEKKVDGRERIARIVTDLARYRLLSNHELFLILRFVLINRDQDEIVNEFFANFYCNQWQTFNKDIDIFTESDSLRLQPDKRFFGKFFRENQAVYQGVFKNRKKDWVGMEFVDNRKNDWAGMELMDSREKDFTLIPLIVDNIIYGKWADGMKNGIFLLINNRNKMYSGIQHYKDDRLFGFCFKFDDNQKLIVRERDKKNCFGIPMLERRQYEELKNHVYCREYYRDGLLDGQKVEYSLNDKIWKTYFYICGVEQEGMTRIYISPTVYYKGNIEDPAKRRWFYREIPDLEWNKDKDSICDGSQYYQNGEEYDLIVRKSADSNKEGTQSERFFNTIDVNKDSCVLYGITNEILEGIDSFFAKNNQDSPSQMILRNYDNTGSINLDRILELLKLDGHLTSVRISSMTLDHNGEWALGGLSINTVEFVSCTLKDCTITVGQPSQTSKRNELRLAFKSMKNLQKCTIAGVKQSDTILKSLRIESFY